MKWLAVNSAILTVSVSAAAAAVPLQAPDDAPPEIAAGEPIVRPVGSSEVVVSEFMTADIVAQNDFVTNVLQKLAIQARRNIITSAAAERLVSANIYGVPVDDALEALLRPNGLGFVQEGEFTYVYTVDELKQLEAGEYRRISRVIHLDYMRSADAKKYAEGMLSDRGSIQVSVDFPDAGIKEEGGGEDKGVSSQTEIYSPGADEYDLRNAIVVHDVPERVEQIAALIKEVDAIPAQILIEASIIQTTLSEENALGVDFALLGNENFTDFFTAPQDGISDLGWKTEIDPNTGEPIIPVLPNMNAFAMGTPGNVSSPEATLKAGYIGNVGVFLRALDQVTDVTLLSNPKVMTLNRQRTKVFVGTRVGYFETTTSMGQVVQTLKRIDTGIVLDVRPFAMQDGRIRLELNPKVSQVFFRTTPEGDIPDEQIQSVTTDVLVPAGHTAVLGGLFREDTSRGRNQIPLLGDMPLIGALFQGREEALRQNEVIFLIKPVLLQDAALIASGREAIAHGEDVRVGSRLGLLYWSRERHSARLNLEAERLLASGNLWGVRFRLRRSLGMHPQQPDVVRALETLDRKELWIKDVSYLSDLIDAEFARMQEDEVAGENGK